MAGTPPAAPARFPRPESAHKSPGTTPPQHRAQRTAVAPALPEDIENDLRHNAEHRMITTQVQIKTKMRRIHVSSLSFELHKESMLQIPFVTAHYRPAVAYPGLC